MKKILFVIGSLRVKSFNRQVAHVDMERHLWEPDSFEHESHELHE